MIPLGQNWPHPGFISWNNSNREGCGETDSGERFSAIMALLFIDKSRFLPCNIHYEWTATPYDSDRSKILSSIMLFIWPPKPQNLSLAVPRLAPTFFDLAKEMATTFLEPSEHCFCQK